MNTSPYFDLRIVYEETVEMRNEMTMYTLKPIISLPRTLDQRETMYEMRNIHEERSTYDHTKAVNKIVPDITEQVISFLKVFIISVILPT